MILCVQDFRGNMAGTYSQIYIQVVFAVRGRQNLLHKEWRDDVFKYMSGIIKNKGQKPIIVNGVSDHVHVFVGLKPSMALSDLVRDVKNNSTNFINDHAWIRGKFSWQEGYGAFSYSHSQIDKCVQLYPESGSASSQTDVSGRVRGLPRKVRN